MKKVISALFLYFALSLPAVVSPVHAWEFYTDCDKYPDSLGCMLLGDVPAGEDVPTETRTLERQSGPAFTGGGCPASVSVSVIGRTLTVLDMGRACSWIEIYMRPLVLLLASISAVFIVVPRD